MTPLAAVALIECRETPSQAGAILLIRRPQRASDPWSGQWALPGGRCQADDVDLLATARRELAEEVGVVQPADAGWTALPVELAGLHRGLAVPVAPFHLQLDRPPVLIPDPREVAAVRWCPLELLRDGTQHRTGRVPGGGERDWQHVDLDGTPLWGFTWRVLSAWLARTG